MGEDSLRDLIARVHQRLSGTGAVDAESRARLTELLHDIERCLAEPVTADGGDGHTSRLESLAVRFEASHPALAETLREVVDALVKAGI